MIIILLILFTYTDGLGGDNYYNIFWQNKKSLDMRKNVSDSQINKNMFWFRRVMALQIFS